MNESALLSVRDVGLRFGGITALSQVSFDIASESTVGLIGPNGAGKTAMLNCITGFYRPQDGSIRYAGEELTTMPTEQIAKSGVGRTFQHAASMRNIGARDVLALGFHSRLPRGYVKYAFPRWTRAAERNVRDATFALADQVGVLDYVREDTPFEELPYGVRKLIDLARALASEPRLLLMDEPGAGLSAVEKATMVDVMQYIRADRDIALVIIDHDLEFVGQIVDELVVLDAGQKIASGSLDDVLRMPEVIASYIGQDGAEVPAP